MNDGPGPRADLRHPVDGRRGLCQLLGDAVDRERPDPGLMVDLMAETCAACPVQEVCERSSRTRVTAGWWAGSFRSPDLNVQARDNDRDADAA